MNPNMNRLGAIAVALMLSGAPAVASQFSSDPTDWDRYHNQDACQTYNDTLHQCSAVGLALTRYRKLFDKKFRLPGRAQFVRPTQRQTRRHADGCDVGARPPRGRRQGP